MKERITIRLTDEMNAALERLLLDNSLAIRSRQDAFRYIVEDWLEGRGYAAPQRPQLGQAIDSGVVNDPTG